jgi:hypothetical protein
MRRLSLDVVVSIALPLPKQAGLLMLSLLERERELIANRSFADLLVRILQDGADRQRPIGDTFLPRVFTLHRDMALGRL